MLTQVCFSRGSDLQKTVTRFEEWRRYSEFYDLDVALREEFGYHMERIKFPPKRTFGNLDPAFVAQRQQLLSEYLQAILQITNVADFEKHHCSKPLRAFVGYDLHLNPVANTVTAAAAKAKSSRAGRQQQGGQRYQRLSRRAAGPSAAPVRAMGRAPITASVGSKPVTHTAGPATGPSSAMAAAPAAAAPAAAAAAPPAMPAAAPAAMPAMPSMVRAFVCVVLVCCTPTCSCLFSLSLSLSQIHTRSLQCRRCRQCHRCHQCHQCRRCPRVGVGKWT